MNRIQTHVHGRWWVSTAEIASPHARWDARYETAVMDTHEGDVDWRPVAHYPTPDAARRGHNRIVKQLRGGQLPR